MKSVQVRLKTQSKPSALSAVGIIGHLSYLPRSHRHRVCLSHFALFFSDEPMGKCTHNDGEGGKATVLVDDTIDLLN